MPEQISKYPDVTLEVLKGTVLYVVKELRRKP